MSPRKKSVLPPPETETTSTSEDVPIVFHVARSEPSLPPCALEGAVIGAKCVVSRTDEGKAVRLLTPDGVMTLDKADLFYTLPAGAKVRKAAEDRFETFRLGVAEGPIFVAASAREAVRRFLEVVV